MSDNNKFPEKVYKYRCWNDPQFCTVHSYKIAKMLAYELLQNYLNGVPEKLEQGKLQREKKTLRKLGLTNHTLIIFASDNGPILNDGYEDQSEKLVGKDKPWGPFKGGKYSMYEAGTRMPTIAYWPGKIKPGISHALIGQVDFYSSLADLVCYKMDSDEAPDSRDELNVLLGKSQSGRKYLLEEAYTLGLRMGEWKYIAPQIKPTPGWLKNKKVATGLSSYPQLYNLKNDVGEENNVIRSYPEIADTMKAMLEKIQKTDGTRPGFKANFKK